MKKLVLASVAVLGFSVNVNAAPVEEDTLWAVGQVSMVCSAHDLGSLADEYFDIVGEIDDLIGDDYEPNPGTRVIAEQHTVRAMLNPSVCVQAYANVKRTISNFENRS